MGVINGRQYQVSSSHTEVPYDLEQLGTYTENYHSISLVEQCNGVIDVPQQENVYISPIQSWIEEAYENTCQFGKQFDNIIHAYVSPSSPPILDHHAGLHFLINVSLLWLVTKDKTKSF